MKASIVLRALFAAIMLVLVGYVGIKCVDKFKRSGLASSAEKEKRLTLKQILTDKDMAFFDVAILRSGKVFAVGFHGSDSKILYFSDDDGKNWTKRSLATTGFVMHGVSFVQDRYGWIVGDGGLVMHTEDSGTTWQMLGRPTNYELSRLQFMTSQVGYAGGGAEIGCQIFRTMDGGKSWDRVYQNLEGGNVFDIAVLNENTALAAINDEFLLRTADAGKTWEHIQLEVQGGAGVTFTPKGIGWVVGKQGAFYYSVDAGRTWRRPATLPNLVKSGDWNSIDFVDEKTGVAVGKKGIIVVTNDGGATWRETKTDVTDDLGKVRLSGSFALIVGSRAVYRLDLPDQF